MTRMTRKEIWWLNNDNDKVNLAGIIVYEDDN